MSNRYRKEYARLGEERLQDIPANYAEEEGIVKSKRSKIKTKDEKKVGAEIDQYWDVRKDKNWTVVPGSMK
jgi:hypothetical protein